MKKKNEQDLSAELAAAQAIPESEEKVPASGITIPPVKGPIPMVSPTLDEGGDYPSDETLHAIRNWPANHMGACLEFVRAAWHWEDWATDKLKPHELEMVHAEEGERFLRLATGGWSGNEDLIAALKNNAWGRYWWVLSSRGGLHIFQFPLADDQAATEVSSPTAASSAQNS